MNQDDQNLTNPTAPLQKATQEPVEQQMISVGGPEAPASMPVAEAAPKPNVEFGYEAIKKIEQGAENLKQIEHKEQLAKSQPPQVPQNQVQAAKPVVNQPVVAPNAVKISGYKVAPQVASNLSYVSSQKGKGDPKQSRTWVVMLLDRLLKRQTYN